MLFSKHNIMSQIKGSDNFFLMNLLSGNVDILSSREAKDIREGTFTKQDEFISKGYLTDPAEEEKLYREKYLEFLDNRETDEVQLFFVSNYSCNFKCSYCYQSEYNYPGPSLSNEITDSFFRYINSRFTNRRKYVTLFGGEPLLPAKNHQDLISYFIKKAGEYNTEVAVVTNGYSLYEYLPLLTKGKIREIQVTLDGTEPIHDQRRPLKNGSVTFGKIVKGINEALNQGLKINLRVVVDQENIDNLPQLAKFAIDQNWTSNPLFKTQLGRNYELHTCQIGKEKLFSRISMYEKLSALIKEYPYILEFHKPAYSVSKFLYEEGELPNPLFDSCPGTKTEWAFDYSGKIYSCTATVGKAGEELGTFYPQIMLNEEKISEWEDRDVLSINECKDCPVQLACCGGCASVAKNKTGSIHKPDCRPVKELLELGIGIYFKDIVNNSL